MCSVPEGKSCWPQPITTIPFPLAMIGLIRGYGINFWPMRQEWKSGAGRGGCVENIFFLRKRKGHKNKAFCPLPFVSCFAYCGGTV